MPVETSKVDTVTVVVQPRFAPPLTSGRAQVPAGGHLGRGPSAGLNRERGPAEASCGEKVTRTARAPKTKRRQRKEAGLVLLFFCFFLVLFSSTGSNCGSPRLAAPVCQEELESRRRCAALA